MLCQRWKGVVMPAVIIFLILYILRPFGISQLERGVFEVVAGSAFITAGASGVFTYLLPALFPAYYEEQNWVLGKYLLNLLGMLLLTATGIWLYQSWLMGVGLEGRFFFFALFWVMVLAPFPIVLFLMWNRNLLLARNLREATEINLHLAKELSSRGIRPEVEKECASGGILTFCGGAREMLEVASGDFLYAEAEGNYVKVCYRAGVDKQVVKKLLRATMKQAEEAVLGSLSVVRCHRAFLVNVEKVVRVDGNSQGYRLRLEGCEEDVPVSRAYAKEVKLVIENGMKK